MRAAQYLQDWDWNIFKRMCIKCSNENISNYCGRCGGKTKVRKELPIELEIAFKLSKGQKLKKCSDLGVIYMGSDFDKYDGER